jgi:hypothetical protein
MRPLGPEPRLALTLPKASQGELRAFLSGTFAILRRMPALPPSGPLAFTEAVGYRLTMADPGDDFPSTDISSVPGMPRNRLLFAGVSGDKCLVNFAAGGLAHSCEVACCRLPSRNGLEPIWAGYCREAKGLSDLQNQIESDCLSQ